MAKKVEQRPIDVYKVKLSRAQQHGWRLLGIRVVNGKSYHEMVRVYRKRGYECNRYYLIGLSMTTGKMIAIQTGN